MPRLFLLFSFVLLHIISQEFYGKLYFSIFKTLDLLLVSFLVILGRNLKRLSLLIGHGLPFCEYGFI